MEYRGKQPKRNSLESGESRGTDYVQNQWRTSCSQKVSSNQKRLWIGFWFWETWRIFVPFLICGAAASFRQPLMWTIGFWMVFQGKDMSMGSSALMAPSSFLTTGQIRRLKSSVWMIQWSGREAGGWKRCVSPILDCIKAVLQKV